MRQGFWTRMPPLAPETRKVTQRVYNAAVAVGVLAIAWLALFGLGRGLSAIFELGFRGWEGSSRVSEVISQAPIVYVVVLAFAMTLSALKDIVGMFFAEAESTSGPAASRTGAHGDDGERIT